MRQTQDCNNNKKQMKECSQKGVGSEKEESCKQVGGKEDKKRTRKG